MYKIISFPPHPQRFHEVMLFFYTLAVMETSLAESLKK